MGRFNVDGLKRQSHRVVTQSKDTQAHNNADIFPSRQSQEDSVRFGLKRRRFLQGVAAAIGALPFLAACGGGGQPALPPLVQSDVNYITSQIKQRKPKSAFEAVIIQGAGSTQQAIPRFSLVAAFIKTISIQAGETLAATEAERLAHREGLEESLKRFQANDYTADDKQQKIAQTQAALRQLTNQERQMAAVRDFAPLDNRDDYPADRIQLGEKTEAGRTVDLQTKNGLFLMAQSINRLVGAALEAVPDEKNAMLLVLAQTSGVPLPIVLQDPESLERADKILQTAQESRHLDIVPFRMPSSPLDRSGSLENRMTGEAARAAYQPIHDYSKQVAANKFAVTA